MESILIRALQLVFSLSILVVVHEFGHFIFAKIFGVRVEKFYLFFNPWFTLYKYKPEGSETEYGIGWLPLGGYVKLSGMLDESMDKEQLAQPEQPWEFRSKPAWQRLLIMIGGVLMNFILAFFLYFVVIFTWGDNYYPSEGTPLYFGELGHEVGFRDGDVILRYNGKNLERLDKLGRLQVSFAKDVTVLRDGKELEIQLPADFTSRLLKNKFAFMDINPTVVDSVVSGMNAEKAGLEAGDEILSVNGVRSVAFNVFSTELKSYKNQEVRLELRRKGEVKELAVLVDEEGKIGISIRMSAKMKQENYSFFKSVSSGISHGFRELSFYVLQLKLLFTKEGIGSIGGFGTIGTFFPPVWDWFSFWEMTAFLSIVLGVMNLLPIPALDGGHVVFLLYEVITRRKPNEKFMEYAQMVGMIFLLGLLLYANGNDLVRYLFK